MERMWVRTLFGELCLLAANSMGNHHRPSKGSSGAEVPEGQRMLSKSEYGFNLWLLGHLCRLNVFPLSVDKVNAKIERQKSETRRGMWILYMSVTSLHLAYITLRLFQTLIFPGQFVLSYFTLHFNYVLGSLMSITWYIRNFIVCPDIPVIIFNHLFDEDSLVAESAYGSRNRRRNPLDFSLQEILAIVLEPCHLFCGLTVTIASIANPDMKLLLYTALGEDYQNNYTFAATLLFEYFLLAFWTNSIYFTLQIQILFFEKLTTTLNSFTSFQRKTARKNMVQRCYRKLQNISLLIKLFNASNSVNIFFLKVLCIIFGVVSGFFAIEYFSLNPALGLYNYSISLDMSILYAVTFQKAFNIPDKIYSFKKEILIKTHALSWGLCRWEKRHIQKLVDSIPNAAIKVGDFKNMERVSTPEFVDFVLRNIAVLLITYKV